MAARELHRLLPPGTLHLSALMCGAHRKAHHRPDQGPAQKPETRRTQTSSHCVWSAPSWSRPVWILTSLWSTAPWRGWTPLRKRRDVATAKDGLEERIGPRGGFCAPRAAAPGALAQSGASLHQHLAWSASRPVGARFVCHLFRDFYSKVDLDGKKVVPMLKVEPKTLGVQFRSMPPMPSA